MINNLTDLTALLKLCRAEGVIEISLDSVSFKLGNLPSDPKYLIEETQDRYESFPDGMLTQEQLIYYSSGGTPEDDPYREDIQ